MKYLLSEKGLAKLAKDTTETKEATGCSAKNLQQSTAKQCRST